MCGQDSAKEQVTRIKAASQLAVPFPTPDPPQNVVEWGNAACDNGQRLSKRPVVGEHWHRSTSLGERCALSLAATGGGFDRHIDYRNFAASRGGQASVG